MIQSRISSPALVIRILGMSTNLNEMGRPDDPLNTETWPSNNYKGYQARIPRIVEEGEWTRWFNFHARAHWEEKYPSSVIWYLTRDGRKLFYTQKFWPDIPGCVAFPREYIQHHFATAKGPMRYFTCSIAWLLAYAILFNPRRIELWGFQLKDTKPNEAYKYERPCFFYWVQQARDRGIEVWYQSEIAALPFEPGDPDAYTGPLYGYGTKPELGWDATTEAFVQPHGCHVCAAGAPCTHLAAIKAANGLDM